MKSHADWPVFVMGAERSGTSTLARFLREELGYAGDAEGHVFNLLQQLLAQTRRHFVSNGFRPAAALLSVHGQNAATTAERISSTRLESALCSAVRGLVRSQHKGLWFDKTPGPEFIRCAPALCKMYPHARFIFLIRDPVSAVESNRRKFGSSFEQACDRWKESAEAWLQSKGGIPQDRYIELKTHELSSQTDRCLDRIADLLTGHPLSMSPSEVRGKHFSTSERTSTGDLSRIMSPATTGWTPEQTRVFRERTSALAAVFGFPVDSEPGDEASSSIHFAAPYGQRNVHIAHGEKGGVWPQLHDGKICIFLHPSVGERTTSMSYRKVELPAAGELSATAYLLPEATAPVGYEIRVVEGGSGFTIQSQTCVCQPGEQKEMMLSIAHACKSATITINTRSISGSVDRAWALVSCPVYQMTPARANVLTFSRSIREAAISTSSSCDQAGSSFGRDARYAGPSGIRAEAG